MGYGRGGGYGSSSDDDLDMKNRDPNQLNPHVQVLEPQQLILAELKQLP